MDRKCEFSIYLPFEYVCFQIKVSRDLPTSDHRWMIKIMAVDSGWPLPQFSTTLLQIVDGDSSSTLTAVEALFHTCSMKNKHSPEFITDKLSFEVNEDASVGQVIGVIQAIDKDQGYNGWVQYITSDPYFGIDSNGRLFVQRPLDILFESQKKDHLMHEIEVVARDQANEDPKSSSIKIQIRINDVNNHAPEFEKVFR